MEFLIIVIGFAIACGVVASNKKRSVVGWVILGLLFSFIAFIILLCLPSLKEGGKASDGNPSVK